MMNKSELLDMLAKGLVEITFKYRFEKGSPKKLVATRQLSRLPIRHRRRVKKDLLNTPVLSFFCRDTRQWMVIFWSEIYGYKAIEEPRKKITLCGKM